RIGEVDIEDKVEDERLPHLAFMRHPAVIGMQHQPGDENAVAHACPLIAAATRSACTVSATSCARMIAAPFSTASRCAAIEPPSRRSGGEGVTASMKRLREAPRRSGRPKDLKRERW